MHIILKFLIKNSFNFKNNKKNSSGASGDSGKRDNIIRA